MAREDYNTYTFTRREDDHSHIPKLPLWMAIIRVFQLILAVLILALCAAGGSVLTFAFFPGYGMGVFTFVWTLLFLGYIGVSAAFFPQVYNIWAHLALEAVTTLFWLVAFALLAEEAAAWNAFNYVFSGYGYTGFVKRMAYGTASTVVARAAEEVANAVALAPRATATSTANSAYQSAIDAANAQASKYNTAIACTKAAAALGAFEWALFVATLIGFGIFVHRHRMATMTTTTTTGAPAPAQNVGMEEHKMGPIAHPQQIPVQQQHTYQQNMA